MKRKWSELEIQIRNLPESQLKKQAERVSVQ